MDVMTPRTSERALAATDGDSSGSVTDDERTDSATVPDRDSKAMTQAEAFKILMVYWQMIKECRRRIAE